MIVGVSLVRKTWGLKNRSGVFLSSSHEKSATRNLPVQHPTIIGAHIAPVLALAGLILATTSLSATGSTENLSGIVRPDPYRVSEPGVAYQKTRGNPASNCWSVQLDAAPTITTNEVIYLIHQEIYYLHTNPNNWNDHWQFESRHADHPSFYRCVNIQNKSHLLDRVDFSLMDIRKIVAKSLEPHSLRGVCLRKSDLRGANLRNLDLRGANFYGADLTGADLSGTNLAGANLDCANLEGVDLRASNLTNAILHETNLNGALLTGSTTTGALFQTHALPHPGGLANITGLHLLTYHDSEHGLALLRTLAMNNGLRDIERSLTYALNHQVISKPGYPALKSLALKVLLEYTCNWGISPGRPFFILVVLIGMFFGIYQFIGRASSS
jgi:hypothetical protein